MSETSTCPLNDFFDIEEENDLDEIKKEDTELYRGSFLAYIYKQFEFCCTNFYDELEKKNKKKNITQKKSYLEYCDKSKRGISQYSVFNKILKKNGDLLKEVPLDSKYFSPHVIHERADWCECAHEIDVELNNEEIDFCIFNFFLKMYRSESRDKDLILSIILECLYSRKNFKKEYYAQKAKLKFLKEIKSIETSNFKQSLNELINIIENTNFTQNCGSGEIGEIGEIGETGGNGGTGENRKNKKINEKYHFKLYIIIKIKYKYGIYIFNCDEAYDIVVIDCNTFDNNKPKILSFLSLRKFISFLNNIYATNFTDENAHDSFPIVVHESKECYALSHNHLPLKSDLNKKKIKKMDETDILIRLSGDKQGEGSTYDDHGGGEEDGHEEDVYQGVAYQGVAYQGGVYQGDTYQSGGYAPKGSALGAHP
ncbi:conserved Plasmodium protein, unknown function [Plasmodium ovale curtisi]|uniref:Uncharacterized protein n=1 Tax=Plasmodium ovale curtisi TaxID=864141 RepID=A0A1A8W6A1_PLAOA|nr:conserved Plasmodium protein, unknown function [Plasmodium ovale curtisi]